MNIKSGYTTVGTAGTPVQLSATNHIVVRLIVHIAETATGPVYIGDSTVSGTGTLSGLEIHESGNNRDETPTPIEFSGTDGRGGVQFKDLWLDSENDGGSLSWLAVIQ
jgi:hypothetical protein